MMACYFLACLLFLASPLTTLSITTVHHDKPEETRIPKMASMMNEVPLNATIPKTERQKRLLPYINYYLGNGNHQRLPPNQGILNLEYYPKNQLKGQHYVGGSPDLSYQNGRITPFLDSNALPGPFVPMLKSPYKQSTAYITESPVANKAPDYSAIYDKLSRLKLVQQIEAYIPNPNFNQPSRKPQVKYVPVQDYPIQPTKTFIDTYTATNIDIPNEPVKSYDKPGGNFQANIIYRKPNHHNQIVPQYITIDVPSSLYENQEYSQGAVSNQKPYAINKPVIYYQQQPPANHQPKPQVSAIVDDNYVAQKFTNSKNPQYYPEVQPYNPPPQIELEPATPHPQYDEIYYQSTPAPLPPPPQVTTESTNGLSQILKQLQDSNTLPNTLTADNIDNSIKTLVKILDGLRKQQKLLKPIVVAQEEPIEESIEDHHGHNPVVTQTFPANTLEGGTPGRPGVDYPALSSIPQTSFSCKAQRYKGFFGDPHTNCQVWHYCDLNGGQASFLCPNGTIFSQVALTCDWWYNVKCSSTAQLYVLNERLYKYILPLSPKFPEDYSGPLVDKYLALKFKEMEEKMRLNKNKKPKKEEDDDRDDSDQLQDIQNENREKLSASSEET